MTKPSEYDRCRKIACEGHEITIGDSQSSWKIRFVPLEDKRCQEIGISTLTGEKKKGLMWEQQQEDNQHTFRLIGETDENAQGETHKNTSFLEPEPSSKGQDK